MPTPVPPPSTPPVEPTALPGAVQAQIVEARHRLRGDAEAAGVAAVDVDAALDRAVERYRDARVHAFVGILVEREVREELGLRRSSAWGSGDLLPRARPARDPGVNLRSSA